MLLAWGVYGGDAIAPVPIDRSTSSDECKYKSELVVVLDPWSCHWIQGLLRVMSQEPREPLTLPLFQTIKCMVIKDIFVSKKYRLGLTVFVWLLCCWGSIPESARFASTALTNWKNRNWKQLLFRLHLDFLIMAIKFFVRHRMLLFSLSLTM